MAYMILWTPNGHLLRGTPLLLWIYCLYKLVQRVVGGPGNGDRLGSYDGFQLKDLLNNKSYSDYDYDYFRFLPEI